MLLFADGDGFWAIKTVIDLIGVVGLFLTLFSIWLSWWLARRDLDKKLADAQQAAIRFADRIGVAWAEDGLTDLLRCLRELRESAREQGWVRAFIRLDDAEYHLVRILRSSKLDAPERAFLLRAADDLRILGRAIQQFKTAAQSKPLSKPKQDQLDNLLRGVALIGSRLRARIVEDPSVSEGNRVVEPPLGENPGGPG